MNMENALQFAANNWGGLITGSLAGIGVTLFLLYLVVVALRSRVRTTNKPQGYLTEIGFLELPNRTGYSDRTAYTMAELSDLAYFRFEGQFLKQYLNEKAIYSDVFEQVKNAAKSDDDGSLESILKELITNNAEHSSEDILEAVLNKAGFKLLGVIYSQNAQGFVCRFDQQNKEPYVVVAFRGTEKNLKDWSVNLKGRGIPKTDFSTEKSWSFDSNSVAHQGFYEAIANPDPGEGKLSAFSQVKKILATVEKGTAVYFTGHSMGGALAMVTCRLLEANNEQDKIALGKGAVYTFGAPRTANYEFYLDQRFPVYRVVNSADIVPRVPPGASFFAVFIVVTRGLSLLFSFNATVKKYFEKLEAWSSLMKAYRHFGDLRYLTDVQNEESFSAVQLLQNPSSWDQKEWFVKGALAGLYPIKSHGMSLYRKKLLEIAKRKNPTVVRNLPAVESTPAAVPIAEPATQDPELTPELEPG